MGKFRDFWGEEGVGARREVEERGKEWVRGEWVGRGSRWGGFEEVVILALLPPHLSHPPPPWGRGWRFFDFVGFCGSGVWAVWECVGVEGEGCGVDNEWVGRGVERRERKRRGLERK